MAIKKKNQNEIITPYLNKHTLLSCYKQFRLVQSLDFGQMVLSTLECLKSELVQISDTLLYLMNIHTFNLFVHSTLNLN